MVRVKRWSGFARFWAEQKEMSERLSLLERPWEEQYLYMFSRLRRGVKDPVEAERLYGRPDIPFRLRYGLVILLGVFAALGAASLAMPPTG